jgi:hypothetical protein
MAAEAEALAAATAARRAHEDAEIMARKRAMIEAEDKARAEARFAEDKVFAQQTRARQKLEAEAEVAARWRREAVAETERVKRAQMEMDQEIAAAAVAEAHSLTRGGSMRGWGRVIAGRTYAAAAVVAVCSVLATSAWFNYNPPYELAGADASALAGPAADARGQEAGEESAVLNLKLAVALASPGEEAAEPAPAQ